jgi:predicted PurR-regulated permease PerM
MLQLRTLDIKSFFFILLLVLLGGLLFNIVAPFLNIIIISLIIAQIFMPLYRFVHQKTKLAGLASLVSVFSSILLVVLPLIFIGIAIVAELGNAFANVTAFLQDTPRVEAALIESVNSINDRLDSLGMSYQVELPDRAELRQQLDKAVEAALGEFSKAPGNVIVFATNFTTEIAKLSVNVLFQGFIFIITLAYVFTIYDKLPSIVRKISPLDNELDNLLTKKFSETTAAVVLGNFVVAIVQATAVLIMLLLLGIGSPALLWAIMVILSLIPVGSGLVWFPVGLFLIFSGNPLGGILLIVYGAVIINVIEAVLRPIILQGRILLHPLVILFSVLGGLSIFGPIGLIYGPLVAVFFASLMEIYNQRYVSGGSGISTEIDEKPASKTSKSKGK